MAAVGEEGAAGNEGHLLGKALHLQILGVHVLGQNDPCEQTAVGTGEGAGLGQLLGQRLQHHGAALAIALADGVDVGVQIEHVDPLGRLHLADGGRLQRGGLLHEVVLSQDLILSADPAQTVSGSQDLGEGAQIDHQTLGVQALQCGHILTLEAQLTVGVILDDGDLIAIDDLHELMTAIQIPGAAGGVLEIGNNVDHLHALGGGQDLLQLVHDHTAVIGGNFDELGLAGLERIDGAQVGGALQQHDVTGVQEHAGREVQTLLRTGGDEDMILVGVDIVLGQHTLGDLLAQARETLSGGILQRLAAVLLQDGDGGLHHLLHGKQLGRGHTAGKGEYVGLRRQLQQLADLGALQQVHSTCKLYHVLFLLKFC